MSRALKIETISERADINLALDTIKLKKQALIFANTKRSAEKAAEDIAAKITTRQPLDDLETAALKALPSPTKQCKRLGRCLKKGVAFHHAGLTTKQRTLIEDNFKAGNVKIICCTPTLCLAKNTKIWHGTKETEIHEFRSSNKLFALSNSDVIAMKPKKVARIGEVSELIEITSVSGYKILVTPEHEMLIKSGQQKKLVQAKHVKRKNKIATIGRLKINKSQSFKMGDFVNDNQTDSSPIIIDASISYFIGAMLGDGYSGAETVGNKIIYKGSPSLVGIDIEIFQVARVVCEILGISKRETIMASGTPSLVLGKNKWFREFLVRCGVEKGKEKHINNKLLNLNRANTIGLLQGLFDTDGFVDRGMGPGFCNTSEKLIRQTQKLLLRFGIVSRIRTKKAGSMKIDRKEYKTLPCFQLEIHQKICILDFYKHIGFRVKRKQDVLIDLVGKICANVNFVECKKCQYKIYKDLFNGRTKEMKEWGGIKRRVLMLLGGKGELRSRELKKLFGTEPKKKDARLNHHYELIDKRRIGSRSKTEWLWSLNKIGTYFYNNILQREKSIVEFFRLRNCPLCENELDWFIKKGWRDQDFEGDIFWDRLRSIKVVRKKETVYDIMLPSTPKNNHMFVAEGFIVHNSMGLDLPAFRTIIKDLRRFGFRGLTYIPVLEYLQMAGRAGRPGYDTEGQAIVIAASELEKEKLTEKYLLADPEDIQSKLAVEPVLRTYLLSLIAADFVSTKQQIFDFFGKTFWAHQFEDMHVLQGKIESMLELLEEWEFLKSNTNHNDFESADNLKDEKYEATRVGKRVAELYLDPYTAHQLILGMQRATRMKVPTISFLHLLSSTLEIRPQLRVTAKDHDDVNEAVNKVEHALLEKEPSLYDAEYDDFLNAMKTALFFLDWIDENTEENLLEKYNIRPGEVRTKIDIADWLCYCCIELTKLMSLPKLSSHMQKLRIRITNGVKEELIPLLKLKGIGRARGRKLHKNSIRTLGDIKKIEIMNLVQILGKATAISVKKQVGQDFDKLKIKENKRKGQISLKDF
jgi:helicase